MNTQIVNVPEKGPGHRAHTQQECPSDGLALTSQCPTAPGFSPPSSSPGSFHLPCFPSTMADLGLLAMSCLGRHSADPAPASFLCRVTTPCVVVAIDRYWGLLSEFKAGSSLTIPVLHSLPERVGCLGSSRHCCLGTMDCPSFPLGLLSPGRMTFVPVGAVLFTIASSGPV